MVNYNKIPIKVAIDTEFTNDKCVSLQVKIQHEGKLLFRGIIFNNEFFNDQIKNKLENSNEFSNLVISQTDFKDSKNILYSLVVDVLKREFPIEEYGEHKFIVYLIFFYSCKDLEYSLGFDFIEPFFKKEVKRHTNDWITQARAIMGTFRYKDDSCPFNIRFKLRDLKGYANSSLLQLARSLNISMEEKTLMDDYKSKMDIGLQEHPIEFVKYSMADVDVTMKIFEEKLKLTNYISNNVLKLPKFIKYSTVNFKQSNGSIVNDLFIKCLTHYLLGKPDKKEIYDRKNLKLQLAFGKLSTFNQFHKGYRKNLSIYQDLFSLKSIDSMIEFIDENDLKYSALILGHAFNFKPYSYGSIDWFLKQDELSTVGYNALVSGGRCNNENPKVWRYKNTVDVDIAGCYGSALENFDYPIGIPTNFAKGFNEPKTSLKEFLKKYENELITNLYKIVVSGKLTFDQDLIYSKLLTNDSLKATIEVHKKQFNEGFDDAAHINANFVLLQNEIENGVITSDILETIRKVATNNELKEFMDLEVVTATFWKKSDYIENIDEWIDHVLESEGCLEHSTTWNALLDKRTRKWVKFPIYEFINPLRKERKRYQKMAKEAVNPEDRKKYNAIQDSIKLIINSLYGVLASIYFQSSNAIVADNITARPRCDAWKLSKAVLGIQVITDGCAYQPEKVAFLETGKNGKDIRKPGFHNLANRDRLVRSKGIKVGPLGGLNWHPIFENYKEKDWVESYDQLVMDHVSGFWGRYGVPFNFELEHKNSNASHFSAFYSKAHYLFMREDKKKGTIEPLVCKIRGVKKEANFKENPLMNFLSYLTYLNPVQVK